jgi:hypothetical protein
MNNIDLIAFMREEEQNKQAWIEDGTITIAELVGGLLRLFQDFMKNIETQKILSTIRKIEDESNL